MAKTQEHRFIALATPLGEDVLLLQGLSGSEALGALFTLEMDLLAERTDIQFAQIVGQNVTVRLDLPDNKTRYFNGYVSRFALAGLESGALRYNATVVPWLWFLTRTANCRIFQEMTVPDIIKKVFRDRGFTDFDDRLTRNYRTWEYCVQYRETDFNFVSRLMEQEGIYYFFTHENGRHTLVLADSPSVHESYPGYEEIACRFSSQAGRAGGCISDWTVETQVQPGAYALNDFDFKNTRTDLTATARIQRDHSNAGYEIYDYPGEYVESGDAEKYARVRIEELQAQHEVVTAGTDARGVAAGHTFALTGHPRDDQNRPYLITSAHFDIDAGDFRSADGGGAEFSCRCTAIDAAQQFRTPRTTPKPSIAGPQTAIVVGPSGEEVYTDQHGRVKVQFHWDRYGQADDKSSCWIRVAQVWAGKKWGGLFLPRVGQEVIVEFLEGDPDHPIITGRVYNGQAMPPYDLPANKTMSTLKSNSSKGGGGFNEIRFEDKKGEEQIFIHAEKNLDVRVKNDRFETVGNDRHLHVEKNKFEHVDNNRNETVDADHKEQIGKDRHLTVKGKEAKEVGESLSLTIKGNVAEVFKANHSEQTTQDYYLKAQNIVIEGMQNITLCVGGSYIAIEPTQIEIKAGAQLKLEGVQVEIKGSAQTTVQGGAMTEVKGGIVKIN